MNNLIEDGQKIKEFRLKREREKEKEREREREVVPYKKCLN